MSRWDFGPEVKSFYEIDCDCGFATAVPEGEAIFDAITNDHHSQDCHYPRRVTVCRRREVPPGQRFHWEIIVSDPSNIDDE
jgi:hypothetical protein